jgi:hypothetical protein
MKFVSQKNLDGKKRKKEKRQKSFFRVHLSYFQGSLKGSFASLIHNKQGILSQQKQERTSEDLAPT